MTITKTEGDHFAAYLEKAKKIAKKQGKNGKKLVDYTNQIAKNLLQSESDSGPRRDIPQWWKGLSPEQQAEYLSEHPLSKLEEAHRPLSRTQQQDYLKKHKLSDLDNHYKDGTNKKDEKKPEEKKAEPSPDDADNDSDDLEAAVPRKSKHHKDDDEEPKRRHGNAPAESIVDMAKSAWNKRRQKSKNIMRHHKQGFHALKKFLTGEKLTPLEQERAKRSAKLAAKLVLGALIGLAIFTPLGPMAGKLALEYINESRSSSYSSDYDSLSAGDEGKFAMEFADGMHEWLMKQDVPALIKKLQDGENTEKQA